MFLIYNSSWHVWIKHDFEASLSRLYNIESFPGRNFSSQVPEPKFGKFAPLKYKAVDISRRKKWWEFARKRVRMWVWESGRERYSVCERKSECEKERERGGGEREQPTCVDDHLGFRFGDENRSLFFSSELQNTFVTFRFHPNIITNIHHNLPTLS